MTAGEWVAVAFLAEFAVAAAVFRSLRRRAGGLPAPGDGHHPARAPHSPAPGNNPVPGTATSAAPPARPSPAPGPHDIAFTLVVRRCGWMREWDGYGQLIATRDCKCAIHWHLWERQFTR